MEMGFMEEGVVGMGGHDAAKEGEGKSESSEEEVRRQREAGQGYGSLGENESH